MTVTKETNKQIYLTNNSQVVFPYEFKIFDDSEMEVTLYTISDGSSEVLTLTTDYTVTGAGGDNGGNVTTVATYDTGYKIILKPNVAQTQIVNLVDNDGSDAEVMEDALDKACILIQQLQEQLSRMILSDISQTTQVTFPSPSADKYIGWDSAGTELENKTLVDIDVIEVDTDTDLGTSDIKVPSQNAVKTYVDTQIATKPGSYSTSFDNGDLVAGVLTVTHNLGIKYCSVTIADNNDEELKADKVIFIDTTSLTIDLTSFGTISGTWNVRIMG